MNGCAPKDQHKSKAKARAYSEVWALSAFKVGQHFRDQLRQLRLAGAVQADKRQDRAGRLRKLKYLVGQLLRACDKYAATPVVRAALKLAPMLLLRPGELRFAERSEIDLDAALWT